MQYGRRNIVDGKAYERYFAAPANEVINNGDNSTDTNVAKILPKVVSKYNWQTKKIADKLYNKDLKTFCKNIWSFLFNHIQYEYDKAGVEQFRTPYRSWAERETGIDCDCFSIFVSCILTNKHIPHYFRITKYNGQSNWQHIYVIVPKRNVQFDANDNDTYYTIDCVIHEFDCEKEYTDQKLQAMNGLGIITQTLNGLEDANETLCNVVLNDNNLGSIDDEMKLQVLATRNWALENPKLYEAQSGQTAEAFAKMCDYALEYWDNPEKRAKALKVLEENEKTLASKMNGLEAPRSILRKNVLAVARKPLSVAKNAVMANFDSDDFDGMGAAKKNKSEKKAEKKAAKAQKKEEKKAIKAEKKEIKKQAKAEAKEERKEKREANKQERQEAGNFFQKVGVALKQGAKAVATTANPAMIAIRGAFLFAVKMNLFSLAKKLHPAYCDDATAKKMGYTTKQIDVAKKSAAATEKIFADKMGGTRAHLKEAVLIGYLKKAQGSLQGLAAAAAELQGLGVVTAAVTAASLISSVPVFVEVLKKILTIEKENGVEGLGSMESEICRTEQLLRSTTVGDIQREMQGLGLGDAEETAEAATGIAKFIKMVLEKIRGFISGKKNKKASDGAADTSTADGSTETKKSKKDNKANGEKKEKGKFGQKVKDFLNKAKDSNIVQNLKDKITGGSSPKASTSASSFNDRPIQNGNSIDSSTRSKSTNTNNMETTKKGLGTGAKVAIGIAAAAVVAGGIIIAVKHSKKKQQPALSGCRSRRKKRKTTRKSKRATKMLTI